MPTMAAVLLTGKVKSEVPSVLVYEGFTIEYADLCRETGVWEYYVDKSNDYRIYAAYKYGEGEATSIMPQQKCLVGTGTHEILDVKHEPVDYQIGEYASDTQIIEFDTPSYIPDDKIKDRFFYVEVPENKISFAGKVQKANEQRVAVVDTTIRKIQLKDADDNLIAETTTDACGRWHFMNLDNKGASNYKLCVEGYTCKTITEPSSKISLNMWELSALNNTSASNNTESDAEKTEETKSTEDNSENKTREKAEEKGDKASSESSEKVLSKEDSEAKIKELQENADAMKAKEQSTANKLLGAASMGSMGIGGMQIASALAEQKADTAAEQGMSAYLATFKCSYGQGINIQGGENNITLPGANILLPIYNEYITLASDLKSKKESLGLSPGIESEIIQDAATSGLYDNKSLGITNTAFTSVSRALMNENSEDAAEWAAQKADTASQLKTGAIVAGVGAAVGIVGNILINEVADKTKESSDQIIAKYDAKRQTIRQKLSSVEQQSEKETTTNPPSAETNKDPNKQDVTAANDTGTKNNEIVETGLKAITSLTGKASDAPKDEVTKALSTISNLTSSAKSSKKAPEPIVKLYNESMFDSGKTEIKNPTTKLDEVINVLKTEIGNETVFEIVLVAHTDKDGIIQTSDLCKVNKICTNEELSAKRAEAVKNYITSKWSNMPSTAKISTRPVGSTCAKGTDSKSKALDRRVDFYVLFSGENVNDILVCENK